jgi:hypothetical protein
MSGTIDVGALRNSRHRVRACRTCALAKTKCVPGESQIAGPCGRCYRLGKDCSGQTPPSKQVHRKHTRIEQLERKIDSLLAAQAWPVPGLLSPAVPPSSPSTNHRRPPQQIARSDASISCLDGATLPTDPLEIFQSELAKTLPMGCHSRGYHFYRAKSGKALSFLKHLHSGCISRSTTASGAGKKVQRKFSVAAVPHRREEP